MKEKANLMTNGNFYTKIQLIRTRTKKEIFLLMKQYFKKKKLSIHSNQIEDKQLAHQKLVLDKKLPKLKIKVKMNFFKLMLVLVDRLELL